VAFETSDGLAVPGWDDVHDDLIPGIECSLTPTGVGLGHGILSLDKPMLRGAPVVLRIDLQKDVWIRPNVTGHRSLYGAGFGRIVRGVPVMGGQLS
jgi:hypothetical protein